MVLRSFSPATCGELHISHPTSIQDKGCFQQNNFTGLIFYRAEYSVSDLVPYSSVTRGKSSIFVYSMVILVVYNGIAYFCGFILVCLDHMAPLYLNYFVRFPSKGL